MEVLLSICVSTYNNKIYLSECIRRMLVYRGEEVEFIVVDNHSSDGTWELLREIRDNRIRVLRNENNVPVYKSYGYALNITQGKYKVMLFDKEYVEPENIKRFICFLKRKESKSTIPKLDLVDILSRQNYKAVILSDENINYHLENNISKKPILSICIPTFNRKDALLYSINRVLAYDSKDLEVVVSDNNSTDGTLEMLADIGDPRLKIIRNKTNLGFYYNYYKALTSSRGKYAICVNDRDSIDKGDLKKYINFLSNTDSDVIINGIENLSIDGIGARMFAMRLFSHPGTYTVSHKIVIRLAKKMEVVDDFVVKIIDEGDCLDILGNKKINQSLNDLFDYYDYVLADLSTWECYGNGLIRTAQGIRTLKPVRISRASDFDFFPLNFVNGGFYSSFMNKYVSDEKLNDYCIGMHKGCINYFSTTWERIKDDRSYFTDRYEGLSDLLPKKIDVRMMVEEMTQKLCLKFQNQERFTAKLSDMIMRTTEDFLKKKLGDISNG